jgi:hypothetical protein
MNKMEKINLFISIYIAQFMNIFRITAWLPFLVLGIVQLIGLIIITNLNLPGFKTIIFPVLNLFMPEQLFHYPVYYLAAPQAYSIFDTFILGPTLSILAIGMAVCRLGGFHERNFDSMGICRKKALANYGRLFFFWLIQTALLLAVILIPVNILEPYAYESPRFAVFVKVALQMAGFLVLAVFIYAIPAMLSGGKSLGTGLLQSLRLFAKNPIFTYFIIFLPGIIKISFDLLTTNFAQHIITRDNPEIIIWALFVNIGVGIFLNLFIYGTAVYAYKELPSQRTLKNA